MKRILSLILFLSILTVSFKASAQFRYGPTVGIDLTTLNFKQDLFKIDQSVGYQAGVLGELMFPGIGFGIDLGLLYTQRGATLDLGNREIWASQGYGRERSYLHYIELPVNLRFKWTRMNGLEDYIAPFVFGGPTFSFLAAHSRLKAFEYAGADLGLQAGVGFELWKRWQIQGSYIWGMTYALKATKLTDFSARNRTWTLRLTYLF